jgi:hypothetical protein
MASIIDSNPLFPGSSSPNIGELGKSLLSNALGPIQAFNKLGKYMTGARCIIKVNGKLAGFAFSVSWNINTAQTTVREIDNFLPYEFAPSMLSVSGSLGMFHVPGKTATSELFMPNVLSFLHHKYISIEVQDQTTGQQLLRVNKAVITNKSQAITAGQISQMTLEWQAIGWQDEMKPAVPVAHNLKKAAAKEAIENEAGASGNFGGLGDGLPTFA